MGDTSKAELTWNDFFKAIKRENSIDIIVEDEGGKRTYCIQKTSDTTTNLPGLNDNNQNYQVKIVIDIESGKLEEVDFGGLVGDGITINKIEEIQKSINICKEENGRVSYGRIAPIRDMSAILSLVKEYYSMLDKTDKLNVIGYQDDLIKQINKSGIRFLCFTEGENGDPQIKRDRFNGIVIRAIEEGVECVSAMYSLEATNTLTMEHSRHSIVAMGFKDDTNSEIYKKYKDTKNCKTDENGDVIISKTDENGDVIIIRTFDSSGSSYKTNHKYSMGTDNDIFIYSQKEGNITKRQPQGMISNCSYWGEGDLIVVFRKYLQGNGITKELLTNQEKWNTEVLGEIICVVGYNNTKIFKSNYHNVMRTVSDKKLEEIAESSSKTCLMKTIVGKQVEIQSTKTQGINHKKEDLKENEVKQTNSPNISLPQQNISSNIPIPPPPPPPPNTSIQKSGQPSPDSDGEGTPTEETPIIQEHEQIRSILPHSFCNITTSNNPSTSSPQLTQSNISPAPLKQSTVPLLK